MTKLTITIKIKLLTTQGGTKVDDKQIQRINELTAISRKRALTDEEQKERQKLRREYIDSMKASLIGQLNNTYIIRPDGRKEKLTEKNN